MSATITMKELLEAGVHFGHQTSKWNPKMKPYIFGARNGIYIIDLQKTVTLAKDALKFVTVLASQGKKVLFVGTKAQCKDVIREESDRAGCPYVAERWLGGSLTNFATIQGCINSLEAIEAKKASGFFDQMPKKERAAMEKEYQRLLKNIGGIRHLKDLPGAMFVVDPSKEHNAVAEAQNLGIPVIAITDTNCDPDPVDFVIPGNDDALKSIRLFASAVADAVLDGAKLYEEKARMLGDKAESKKAPVAVEAKVEESTVGKESTTTDREGRTVDVEVRRRSPKANA
ncbi:MAG TPA: 30S ribosomal protein S2 [Bdellovibrionota bacterium]|nr:30S ribosomal protein S2 [Bdellovibrionota bacterium]